MRTQYRLAEKTALVIGPLTRHLSQVALRLADEGCDVAIATHDTKPGENLANAISDLKEINSSAGRATCIPLSASTDAESMMKAATTAFGALDILIEMSEGDPTPAVQQALVYIKNRRHGRILVVRPLLAHVERADLPALKTLHDAPAAKTMAPLITNWASDFQPPQLTINGVILGATEELLTKLFPQAGPPSKALAEIQKVLPKIKLADASDVAETITFLSSTLSSAIHGQIIPVIQGPLVHGTAESAAFK